MNQDKYIEKIISQHKCVDFLKFKFNNKIVPIDKLDISSDNSFRSFIEQALIIYKEKEFTFEEYKTDLNLTRQKFASDLIDNTYIKYCDEFISTNIEYYIILKFFEAISSNITFAKYYADKSYEKLPERFIKNEIYDFTYFYRAMDFLTSIIWYSTGRDYLLQIFCAKFNLYSELTKDDTTNMNLNELAVLCKFNKVQKIKDNYLLNKDFCDWYNKLYQCQQNMNKLNTISNNLKHNGGYNIENFNGSYNKIDFPNIDIDEEYNILIDAHNNIVECYNYFLSKINEELNLLHKNRV